jgi:hypothetical protein
MKKEDIDYSVAWDFTKEYCDYNELELTDVYDCNISNRGCIAVKFRYTNHKIGWSRTDVRFMDFDDHNDRLKKKNRKKNLKNLLGDN